MQGCYEIHLFEPLGKPQTDRERAEHGLPPRKVERPFVARHYIGFSEDIDARLEEHRRGNGSAFMAAVSKEGIRWTLARVWPDKGRDWERYLKNQKHAARLCPICNQSALSCCTGSKRGKQ